MPVLKSLSFTALPKLATDPVHIRRAKLISRLEEQKALLDDPNLIRTTQRTVKEDGEKRIVPKQQKVRPWWRADSSGHLFMSIRFSGRDRCGMFRFWLVTQTCEQRGDISKRMPRLRTK